MLKIAILVKIVKLFHYNDAFQHLLKHMFPLKIIAGARRSAARWRRCVNKGEGFGRIKPERNKICRRQFCLPLWAEDRLTRQATRGCMIR
jgi:hypothetical protein